MSIPKEKVELHHAIQELWEERRQMEPTICLLGPLRTEKHLWRIMSAAIAVAMVTGITRCM